MTIKPKFEWTFNAGQISVLLAILGAVWKFSADIATLQADVTAHENRLNVVEVILPDVVRNTTNITNMQGDIEQILTLTGRIYDRLLDGG